MQDDFSLESDERTFVQMAYFSCRRDSWCKAGSAYFVLERRMKLRAWHMMDGGAVAWLIEALRTPGNYHLPGDGARRRARG